MNAPAATIGVAVAAMLTCYAPAARAQTIAIPSATPAAPAPTQSPVAPPQLGPVLVAGKATYVLTFGPKNSQTITATQSHAPAGAYFIATPGTICLGAINVVGSATVGTGMGITSSGAFTFTRVGNPVGCAVSISSSAGGTPATVVF